MSMMLLNSYRFGAVAAPDPHFANTVLLLSGNGANGSAVFPDESFADRGSDPVNGTGVVVSTTPIGQFGTGTILFDGVNDRLAYASSEHWYFKAGEFTVEGRFAFAAGGLAVDQTLIAYWDETSNRRGWRLIWNGSTDTLEFHFSTLGSDTVVLLSAAFTPTADQLYHIVVDRDGNDFRLYVDGVMLDKETNAITQRLNKFCYLRLGSNLTTVDVRFFNGRMEEIRITKGVARYADDAGFAPITLAHSRANGTSPSSAYPYTLPIKNGGSEVIGGVAVVPPRHWTNISGNFQGSNFGPSGDGTQGFEDGSGYFYAGNTAGTASMRQDVEIPSGLLTDVDAAEVRIVWGWVQSCTTTDSQRFYVDFLNAANAVISSAGPGLMSDGGGNTWVTKGFNALVPALTRKIRFVGQSNRADGTSNDGYGDNLSARLEKIPTRGPNEGPSSDRWRVITNSLPFSDSYIRLNGALTSRFAIADLQMCDVPGGADQCTGGTASASSQYSASFPAANAFDATLTDGWIKGNNANNDSAAEPHWLEYTFAAPVHVNSIKINSRSALEHVSAGAPYNFDVEYWDGAAWVVAWTCTTERHWGQTETRQFDKPL